MRKRIFEIGQKDNDAIRREIGERLRARQRAEPAPSQKLKEKVDELRRLEEQSS